ALAFARYLPMYGWRPVVLTVDAAWATNRDDDLLRLVPHRLEVVRTASLEGKPASSSRRGPEESAAQERNASGRAGGRGSEPTLPREVGAADCGPHMRERVAKWLVPAWSRRQLGHLRRFPDAHLGWLPFAIAAAWRRQDVDLVYSSSGPFTCHLVGLILSKLLRKPWVAELRDGWYLWNRAIFADYPGWRGPIERRLEAAVIRSADRVLLVTERMAAAFRSQYADVPADHFRVVTNGFDPRQVTVTADHGDATSLLAARAGQGCVDGAVWDASPATNRSGAAELMERRGVLERASEATDTGEQERGSVREPIEALDSLGAESAVEAWNPDRQTDTANEVFEVVHAGALYYGRSITAFLDAADRLMRKPVAVDSVPGAQFQVQFGKKFRLTLIGSLDATAGAELARHPIGPYIRVEGQLSHATVMQRLRRASLLLLVANTTRLAEATVPGKLFEYLAIGRPILALAPRASSTADVLAHTGGAWLAPGDDVDAITAALREAFESWQAGRMIGPDPRQVARYSRTRLAGELARVFEEVLASRAAGRAGADVS
ncbi:MAG: glycosyltransferase, partial [Chloroflexi bacterium]|nr:glycosyltransferase [Chloroflexota bacterium]